MSHWNEETDIYFPCEWPKVVQLAGVLATVKGVVVVLRTSILLKNMTSNEYNGF
jgi:hypothetical protein